MIILSRLCPLHGIAVTEITEVSHVGGFVTIVCVDEEGNRSSKTQPATEFVLSQIKGYGIEVYEDRAYTFGKPVNA